MKKTLLAMAAMLSLAGSASAQTYVGSIDVSTELGLPGSGIQTAHLAAGTSGTLTVLYLNTLNGGAVQNLPVLQIVDPLGAATVNTFDINDAGGAGVSATRGSGGIAVADNGNVLIGWTGNGNDDSARLRLLDPSGNLVQQVLWASLNDRLERNADFCSHRCLAHDWFPPAGPISHWKTAPNGHLTRSSPQNHQHLEKGRLHTQ